MPSRRILLVAVTMIVIGMVGYTVFIGDDSDSEEPDPELDFDHTFTDQSNVQNKIHEEPLDYKEVVLAHNTRMRNSSYQFSYERQLEKGSVRFTIKVDRSDQKIYDRVEIEAMEKSSIRESYFNDGLQYVRVRERGQSSQDWQYTRRVSKFRDLDRTAFDELKSLEVRGTELQYMSSITRDGIKYYVYEPKIVDSEVFEENKFRPEGENGANSIEGEVLVSEYGFVTSARIVYIVNGAKIEINYSLDKVGELEIDEPIWLPEAQSD